MNTHLTHHVRLGRRSPGRPQGDDPGAITRLAVRATSHCLTGCAIGEVAGFAIGTALGWSDATTIALAIGLAFLFGYSLTALPLLRSGLPLRAVVLLALAADTISIAVMEIVDNASMILIPGAMDAGLADAWFWGTLAMALAIAFAATVPVNRALIARGRGHAAVHETVDSSVWPGCPSRSGMRFPPGCPP